MEIKVHYLVFWVQTVSRKIFGNRRMTVLLMWNTGCQQQKISGKRGNRVNYLGKNRVNNRVWIFLAPYGTRWGHETGHRQPVPHRKKNTWITSPDCKIPTRLYSVHSATNITRPRGFISNMKLMKISNGEDGNSG